MRLTTKFSAFVTLLVGLAMLVTLLGCSLSFFNAIQHKVTQRVASVAAVVDNELVFQSPQAMQHRLDEMMVPLDIVRIEFELGGKVIFSHERPESYRESTVQTRDRQLSVPLIKHPGMTLRLTWQDPLVTYYRSLLTTAPLTLAFALMVVMIYLSVRWITRQLAGQELLEGRAVRILNGERGANARGNVHEWRPTPAARSTFCSRSSSLPVNSAAVWIRSFAPMPPRTPKPVLATASSLITNWRRCLKTRRKSAPTAW